MIVFTFPGQGSQRSGMGQPWTQHPSWEIVTDASRASGRDLDHLLITATAEELTETRNAQLATFVLSLVILDSIERLGIEPLACAGHSLGEYSALVAAGSVSFEEGVQIVAERGEAMQAAADDQPGTMAAVIGLEDDEVEIACLRADGDVWVANYNSPGQVVIAGTKEGVAIASQIARDKGAKKVAPLQVGGAFHTPLMASARDRLRKALAQASFRDPEVPITANVDAQPHEAGSDWEALLSAQLCSPVRWRQTLEQLDSTSSEATTFIEVGPGGVLTGLARRSIPSALTIGVSTPEDLDKLVEALAGETPLSTYVANHHGEHLYMSERLVISHSTGLFTPAPSATEPSFIGEAIEVGSLLGTVGEDEVRSPFAGAFMGMLAIPGERVTPGQPIAWLRCQ